MGVALRILGRLLFIVLFVGAGIDKVSDPAKSAQYMNVQYQSFHKWVQTTTVFKQVSEAIPPAAAPYVALVKEYTSPAVIQDHSKCIISTIGYTQLVTSALVLVGLPLAGWVLYIFCLLSIVVIHNPFANTAQFHSEFMNAVLNLAIAGIALFIAADICPTAADKIQATAETSPQKRESKKPSQAATVSKPTQNKKK